MKSHRPPKMFRPLLWSLRWDELDIEQDKDDIIISGVNEGTLNHWRWILKTYRLRTIQSVLQKHLASEFHPESRSLARVVFAFHTFRHAR